MAGGDCNDCNPLVNPGAVELGGNLLDDDCDGTVDNVEATCDAPLLVDDANPLSGARAVDLCRVSNGSGGWGVVSANWVLPDGSFPAVQQQNFHLGHGILSALGPNVHVQKGQRMLALSSGTARQPTDPGYQDVAGYDKGYACFPPPGFPKESPACPGVITGQGHDGVALELTIRVPSNAVGFSYDFNHFTYEWPGYLCSSYNDVFLALVYPAPPGLVDGNIAFDPQGNLISVNTSFLEVCGCSGGPPCVAGGKTFLCPLGKSGLVGTGYQSISGYGASTGWLTTSAPAIAKQTIKIRWTVYDSGDGVLDATTLIDNWRWLTSPGVQVATSRTVAPQ